MGLIRIKPILQTWGRTLQGRAPSLSIEITRECPLRCPGCDAYEDSHLGTTNLRSLSDFKGRELIARVLALMDQYNHCIYRSWEATPWFDTASLTYCCRSWSIALMSRL